MEKIKTAEPLVREPGTKFGAPTWSIGRGPFRRIVKKHSGLFRKLLRRDCKSVPHYEH